MAGAGYKLFVSGDVLTAAQVNTYLNEQTVMVFATSAARTSALSLVLAEGMMSYLQDSNTVFYYDGAAWNALASGDITAITAGTGISVTSGTGPVPTVEIDTTVTVDKTTVQTLTNKTLTSPALTTPTISTLTTNGDLVYGTGSGALSRLGIGSSAQVLTVASGIPSWATPAVSSSGLTLITTSNFTAVSSHSINSCFSASYVFYEVRIKYTAVSASPEMSMRMRVSGTDATTDYALTRLYAYNTTSGFDANAALGTGSLWIGGVVNGYADRASHRLSIGTPFQAAATTVYDTSCYQNGTANTAFILMGSGAHATQTSYDGFTILTSTGTATGTVYVYGLAV